MKRDTINMKRKEADVKIYSEEARRGKLLADVLGLELDEENRWPTEWGNKTNVGLYRMVERILEDKDL